MIELLQWLPDYLLLTYYYKKEGMFMAVVNNLKEIRKERSLNQKELAEAAGTCERTISRIERCERNLSLEMALRLSTYLGLAVEEVFSYEKP